MLEIQSLTKYYRNVPVVNNVSFKENIVRAGLNYKFSGPIYSRF